ncbi:ABC transporter permease [Bacillus sp. T33-2]|uniref:ABC transporter permease n=1 Tax=Bacillus sp. T33-2 TaxID=2054168 RepID=UPI000C78B21F|nr:ABC transporter permease subunit [Bacillus sp. T33-2]PLR94180.1 ABC transporter permease [Bacillus sp. T33-2]
MNKLLRINFPLYIGVFLVSILLFLAIFGPSLAPHELTDQFKTKYIDGDVVAPPVKPFETKEWPLGTDRWGYDLASKILIGIRYTIFVALAVTFIKMVVGTVIGIYVGTWKRSPQWLVAFENAWGYVPLFLILYFFLRPITFNSPLEANKLIWYFILIASAVSIPSIISSVRQKTQEVNKSVFIEAARALGAGKNRMVWRHIFPQMKESLLIMFVLEIVYVITMMGQLALVNIFLGGTYMTFDPILYHSITQELSGLVGQNRSAIYGADKFVLLLPFGTLILITIAFSLLANGLKNRFQSNYQRNPWIKTGQEPRLIPQRKNYSAQSKLWPLRGERLAVLLLLLVFVLASLYVLGGDGWKMASK